MTVILSLLYEKVDNCMKKVCVTFSKDGITFHFDNT